MKRTASLLPIVGAILLATAGTPLIQTPLGTAILTVVAIAAIPAWLLLWKSHRGQQGDCPPEAATGKNFK